MKCVTCCTGQEKKETYAFLLLDRSPLSTRQLVLLQLPRPQGSMPRIYFLYRRTWALHIGDVFCGASLCTSSRKVVVVGEFRGLLCAGSPACC
jgi:hypothetical protein